MSDEKRELVRIPIIGLRQSVTVDDGMSWDDQYSKLNNYIKYAAKELIEQHIEDVSTMIRNYKKLSGIN